MIIGSKRIFTENLTSTNTEAALLLKSGNPDEGTVIFTDFQSSGKGQPGRRWESERGKNLLLSIILYPKSVAPEEQFIISQAISLGIHDLMKSQSAESKIKWPNDIYVKDDKIAGILIESSIMGGRIESSVIGIGININQTIFPCTVPNPVSLKLLTGKDHNRDLLLDALLGLLDIRYKQLLYGSRDKLREEYAAHLYRLGEWNEFRSGNKAFRGMINGVTTMGKVRIKMRGGEIKEYAFKEVEYVL